MNPIIKKAKAKLALLSKKHRAKNLYIFGSVTTNRFTPTSDIDFLVEFQPMDFGDYTDNYFQFCFALEALFNRKVDLATTNSLSNPYFIESVNKTKKLVYSANRDKKTNEIASGDIVMHVPELKKEVTTLLENT